jgi:hypothetical protein
MSSFEQVLSFIAGKMLDSPIMNIRITEHSLAQWFNSCAVASATAFPWKQFETQ